MDAQRVLSVCRRHTFGSLSVYRMIENQLPSEIWRHWSIVPALLLRDLLPFWFSVFFSPIFLWKRLESLLIFSNWNFMMTCGSVSSQCCGHSVGSLTVETHVLKCWVILSSWNAPPPPQKKKPWKPHWFLCCGPNLASVSACMPVPQGLSQPLFIFWTPRDYGKFCSVFKRFWFSSWICFSEQLWKLSCFEGETSCVFEIPEVTHLVILAPGD